MIWLDSITDTMEEMEQTLGDSQVQRILACCTLWVCKVSAVTW